MKLPWSKRKRGVDVEREKEKLLEDIVDAKLSGKDENQDLDKKIIAVQNSTRTTIPSLIPLHDKLRMKSKHYHKYSAKGYSSKINWLVLVITIFATAYITFDYFGPSNELAKAVDGCSPATDGNWSTVTWSGTGCSTSPPAAGDTVKIDKNVVLDINPTIAALYMIDPGVLSGGGNLTVTGDVTCSGTCGTISLTSGIFEQRVAANQTFGTIQGSNDWSFSTLKFSNSSGSSNYTVTTNSGGTGKIIASALSVGKATDTKNAIFNDNVNDRTLDINGDVSVDQIRGLLYAPPSASFTIGGVMSNYSVFAHDNGTVIFDGTGSYNLLPQSYYNLIINNGTYNLSGSGAYGGTYEIKNNLTVNSTLTTSLTSYGNINIGGNITGPGLIDFSGDTTSSDYGVHWTISEDKVLGSVGNDKVWHLGNLHISSTPANVTRKITKMNTTDIGFKNVSISMINQYTGTVKIQLITDTTETWTLSSDFTSSLGPLSLVNILNMEKTTIVINITTSGAAGAMPTLLPALSYYNLTINNPASNTSGIYRFGGIPNMGIPQQYVTPTPIDPQRVEVRGKLEISKQGATGSIISANTGTVLDFDINDLVINAGNSFTSGVNGTCATPVPLTISGNFTNQGTLAGCINSSGTVVNTDFGITFDGTGTQLINTGGTGIGSKLQNVTHSGTGELQLVTSAMQIDGTFTNSAGTFNANDQAITIAGTSSISGGMYMTGTAQNTFTGAVTVSGTAEVAIESSDITKSSWTNSDTSTIVYSSSQNLPTIAGLSPYINLAFNGTGTHTLTETTDVSGSVTINSGTTLSTNSKDINVEGNWSNSGTFKPGIRTVTLIGTATSVISGNTSFNNLVIDTTTDGAKTVNFGSNSTQTIENELVLKGASGKILTLGRSGGSGIEQYVFAIPGDMISGDYINVSNNKVAGGTITARANVEGRNSNNTNWIFPSILTPTPTPTTASSSVLSVTSPKIGLVTLPGTPVEIEIALPEPDTGDITDMGGEVLIQNVFGKTIENIQINESEKEAIVANNNKNVVLWNNPWWRIGLFKAEVKVVKDGKDVKNTVNFIVIPLWIWIFLALTLAFEMYRAIAIIMSKKHPSNNYNEFSREDNTNV